MAENKLVDMSTEFAIQILKLTENIKGHYSLSNQLERSGTSIGANIRERTLFLENCYLSCKPSLKASPTLLFTR